MAVLVCHIAGYWTFMALPWKLPELMALGAHGVDVFIVISGFVLFLPVVKARGYLDSRQFYGRRAFRILPAYYLALLFAAILAMWSRTAPLVVGERATVPELLLHVGGMQTWFPGSLGSINGSLWSISLELHLYLIFPLLVVVWKRWGLLPIFVVSVVLAVLWDATREWGVSGPVGFGLGGIHALPARLLQFVIGMWCAVKVVSGDLGRPRTWLLAVLGTGLLATIASTAQWHVVAIHTAWGALGAALVMLACSHALDFPALNVTEKFGERSYSFYLLHQPVLLILAPAVALLPGWPTQLVVGGLGTFIIISVLAHVMYGAVELPTHKLGRRFFPNPTGGQRRTAPTH